MAEEEAEAVVVGVDHPIRSVPTSILIKAVSKEINATLPTQNRTIN